MNFIKVLFVTVVFIFSFAAFAADTKSTYEPPPAWLTEAKREIKSGKYEDAIKVLNTANQQNSADWNNLMGYSLRRKNTPDFVASESFYLAALKIEPEHKGALEYYGELLLMKNDVVSAEQMLKRLDKACFFSCEEYRDLKQSISNYKSKNQIKSN
jgi:Flp pilus assembly protein TadD